MSHNASRELASNLSPDLIRDFDERWWQAAKKVRQQQQQQELEWDCYSSLVTCVSAYRETLLAA